MYVDGLPVMQGTQICQISLIRWRLQHFGRNLPFYLDLHGGGEEGGVGRGGEGG